MTDLQPGPEMDEVVCKLLGIAPRSATYSTGETETVHPPVSTNRTAMWLVWDALNERGYSPTITQQDGKPKLSCWIFLNGSRKSFAFGQSPPEALCRAVITALGGEK